jgi:pyruvate dehydrogenase E1 component alpha subunit
MESLKTVDKNLVDRMYEGMLRIRLFEETQSRVFKAGEQEGFTHLYLGEEAIAVGACLNLDRDDFITSTHRGHGHMIAKGGDFKKMMAELYGRSTGQCLGRSGSLHIADRSIGMLGANGIVGDGNPIAVGAGYSIRLRGTKQVVVSFFGDGATNQGTFHESLNMAASWDLPVIFVIENNGLSCGTLTESVCRVLNNLGDRAAAYGIPGENINGMDVLEVYRTVGKAVERARAGRGPTLVNCKTYRHHGHFEGDIDIRSPEQVEEAQRHDAVADFERRMLDESLITDRRIQELRSKVQQMVDEAVEFARNSPPASAADAMKFVYAE